jgi:hypothetical protein
MNTRWEASGLQEPFELNMTWVVVAKPPPSRLGSWTGTMIPTISPILTWLPHIPSQPRRWAKDDDLGVDMWQEQGPRIEVNRHDYWLLGPSEALQHPIRPVSHHSWRIVTRIRERSRHHISPQSCPLHTRRTRLSWNCLLLFVDIMLWPGGNQKFSVPLPL